jgi:ABC-2 type transport system ATP-binding protein
MDEIAINVVNVSKSFKLPHERASSIKSIFIDPFKSTMHKNTENQQALKNVSFSVNKGEFFGIVGRNGSGKSTLLKMLAGIYQPNKGDVVTVGKLVPFIELGVGFNPELTGRENVYLNGALLGFSRAEIDAQYDEIVEFAELKKFMDQKLKNYSSGMQVRLAFSMAIRAKADILLIDEVLAVGDADFQRKCFDYFRKLKKESTTVVFVSHNMDAVREYCDRALLIDKTKIIFEGTAQEVAAEYSKLFLKTDGIARATDGKQERWGDATAMFYSPKLTKTKDGEINLSLTIQTTEKVDDPIVGYYFMNEQGQQVCGTNTQILEYDLGAFEPGKKYKLNFAMKNVFADGDYSVTLALLRESGSVITDWWVNAAGMSITKAHHVPYLVDLPAEVTIKESS